MNELILFLTKLIDSLIFKPSASSSLGIGLAINIPVYIFNTSN